MNEVSLSSRSQFLISGVPYICSVRPIDFTIETLTSFLSQHDLIDRFERHGLLTQRLRDLEKFLHFLGDE